MSNHFHLAVEAIEVEELSRAIGKVCERYSRYWRKRYGGAGTLWQGHIPLTPYPPQKKFIVLTQNLLLLLEHNLERDEGITDEKVIRRRQARLKVDIATAARAKRRMSTMLTVPKRATQRSFPFLRWLRSELSIPTPWWQALNELRPLMDKYLC